MSCMVVGYNPAGNIIGIVTYIISIVWIVFFFVKAFEFPGPIAGSGTRDSEHILEKMW